MFSYNSLLKIKGKVMEFNSSYDYSKYLEENDSLYYLRDNFYIPKNINGEKKVYFCGNSLGLQSRNTSSCIQSILEDWQNLAVEAHFLPQSNWYKFCETLKPSLSKLLGCSLSEISVMNSLTVNLHLMLFSFFNNKNNNGRNNSKILILESTFPSDRYAVQSFLKCQGLDPNEHIVELKADIDGLYSLGSIENTLKTNPDISLMMLEAISYITGELLPLEKITLLAKQLGVVVGFNLAHAIGNIPLKLSSWGVDFAVWCSYKYLNGGPGAIGGCFINKKYHALNLPRLAGWWGNDPETRFSTFNKIEFVPDASANGWQISNPPILSAAPLLASLKIFDEINLEILFNKATSLTNYLALLIEAKLGNLPINIISPYKKGNIGSQLSLKILDQGFYDQLRKYLLNEPLFIFDLREPLIMRVTPVPSYNSYTEIWWFVEFLQEYYQKFKTSKFSSFSSIYLG